MSVSQYSSTGLLGSARPAVPIVWFLLKIVGADTLYTSGGTIAENSPVSASVLMYILPALSPLPRQELLLILLLADAADSTSVLFS